jgi:hypothetical protein
MFGVEVLDLVLGILPFLVLAIEHYEGVLRLIRRYIVNSPLKAQRLCDEIEAEQKISQVECQLLSRVVVDLDVAKEMPCDPNRPSWRDEVVCMRFSHRLGTLGRQTHSLSLRSK